MSGDEADDLVHEVREIRERLSVRFGHDVHRFGDHLRKIQHQFPNRVVTKEELTSRKKKPAA